MDDLLLLESAGYRGIIPGDMNSHTRMARMEFGFPLKVNSGLGGSLCRGGLGGVSVGRHDLH